MRRWLYSFGVLAVMASAACSVEEPLPPRQTASAGPESSSRVGSLLAEFETASTGQTTGQSVRINAHFLDARGLPAERALEALEVWSPEQTLDRDTCVLRSGPRQPERAVGSQMHLQLLGVGPITVEGPRRDLQLQARRLPDLSAAFSGVIYGSGRTRQPGRALTYRPGAAYVFRAPGGGSTSGFRVRMEAPAPIDLLSPAPDARALEEGESLQVRWRSRSTDKDVFFDVSSGFGADRVRLKCRLENDGRFVLPADLLANVADGADRVQLAVRHVETRPVHIDGLDVSEFTVSTVEKRTLRLQ